MQELIQRVAPDLALKPRVNGKGWQPAPTDGGLTPPENMYDRDGTPLNWMQEQGGQRQFFVPEGQQAYTSEQLRGLTPEPSMELRGTGPVEELPPNAGLTMRGLVPPEVAGSYSYAPTRRPGGFQTMNEPVDLMRNSPRARANIPPEPGDIEVIRGRGPDSATARIPSGGPNETLGDMLSRLNFSIPQLRVNKAGTGADGLRGRNTEFTSKVGTSADAEPPSAPRRTSARYTTLDAYPNFGSADGLSDFNQRMNLNIGTQVRSPAVQASLVSRGATQARRSWHTSGRAADITPDQLGGLTGQEAVAEVRRRLQAAGYPAMDVIWESGHGRGQGTGAHVHIEPTGSPQ